MNGTAVSPTNGDCSFSQKHLFITMKKTYLRPETELISVKFNAIMLSLSNADADPAKDVLGKERNFINFADGCGIEE